MVERPTVDDLATLAKQPREWIVRGHLNIVAIAGGLRSAVQLCSLELAHASGGHASGEIGYLRLPGGVPSAVWRVDLDISRLIAEQHLPGREREESASEWSAGVVGGIRNRRQ